jgi:hypothetical protein
MRVRNLLAGTLLALLTLTWTAPVALAADIGGIGGNDPTPPIAGGPRQPGANPGSGSGSENGGGSSGNSGGSGGSGSGSGSSGSGSSDSGSSGSGGSGSSGDSAKPVEQPKPPVQQPKPPVEPPAPPNPVEQPKPVEPSTDSKPPAVVVQPKPIPADPTASLSLSPSSVKPGGTFTAVVNCGVGTQDSLSGDGVTFSGTSGTVLPNVGEGSHTVTLVCANATKRATATASLLVLKGDQTEPDPQLNFAVSPRQVSPGDDVTFVGGCPGGWQETINADGVDVRGRSGRVRDDAQEGAHNASLVCLKTDRRLAANAAFFVVTKGGPGGDTLSVSPKRVRQGDRIDFNGSCRDGRQQYLTADDVDISGRSGTVRDNARLGDHEARRSCFHGNAAVVVTDHFEVIPGDNSGPGDGPRDFWLSDRSGYRGDSVDVSVRCRDDRAQLDSDALDDITLRRDGFRLSGTTHVTNHVGNGWHRVTVSCDGHSITRGFLVLSDRRDHDEYLSVDPGYGERGDEVDIRVGCDWSVGRVESDALDDIDVDHDGRPWRYSGSTHVSDDADAGEHTVRVRCGDHTLEESFFVKGDHGGGGGGGGGGSDGDGDEGAPDGGEQVSVYPVGAPETGGGPLATVAPGGGPAGSSALVALGLLGGTGAASAGVGSALARREARR